MRLHAAHASPPKRPLSSRPTNKEPFAPVQPAPPLSFILIVEDNAKVRRFIKFACAPLARDVTATGSARRALAIAAARPPDRILVDLRLPVLHGAALIARLRRLYVRSPIIVLAGFADDLPDEIAAMGVKTVLHKPVTIGQLQNAIRAVPESSPVPPTVPPAMNAAERWVAVVEAGHWSINDPRTRTDLARCGHVSLGVLKETCYRLHIGARQTCRLVRVLRALRIGSERACQLADLLDVGDHRTIGSLLDEAGLTGCAKMPSVADFLGRQRFIPQTSLALQLLVQRIARRP